LPSRPPVDVVVPFAGSQAAFEAVVARLARLPVGDADTIVLADNRGAAGAAPGPVRVVAAGQRRGSYFARNRGAAAGGNPWLVFLDADVLPDGDLLDAYFAAPVGDAVGVLAGTVVDEPRPGAAARYAGAVGLMSQDRRLERPAWAYAQTSNCAVRRAAFEAVGGFRDDIRSGGDADLCVRLRAAGWALERSDGARAVHRSRTSVAALLRQRARVGAGARWLEERYPGFAPRRPLARSVAGDLRRATRAARDRAPLDALQALGDAAFQIGWRLPNRP